jgi:hypothetical protein
MGAGLLAVKSGFILFIKNYHWHYHLIISDSTMWKRLQNVYSQMKHTRLKSLSQVIWQPPPLDPVSYQPPTHRRLRFLDVRNIVSHLHVHTQEHSVNQHNLVVILPNPYLASQEVVNEHSYCPTPYPASRCFLARRVASPVCLIFPKRNCTQQHLNHDVFSVDLYDHITGDSCRVSLQATVTYPSNTARELQ